MSHTIKFGDQQGASDELPTNGRLWVGCGSRGVIIAEVRLGFVGAVAVDVGPWWKGGVGPDLDILAGPWELGEFGATTF